MIYLTQLAIYVIFLCAVILIRILVQGILSLKQFIRKRKRDREYLYSEKTIELLYNQFSDKPTEFEGYTAAVFEHAGYEQVTVTCAVNDGGKDIIMYKNGKKYVAEVKLYWPDYKISRERIQKLHSAMLDSDAEGACFVTTSDFTKNAVVYAGKHGIDLINGQLFARLVKLMEKSDGHGSCQLHFLHEMIEEEDELIKYKNRSKSWLLEGIILCVYPIYSITYISFFDTGNYRAGLTYVLFICFMIFLNAVNLRVLVKCLVNRKKYCGLATKSV